MQGGSPECLPFLLLREGVCPWRGARLHLGGRRGPLDRPCASGLPAVALRVARACAAMPVRDRPGHGWLMLRGFQPEGPCAHWHHFLF